MVHSFTPHALADTTTVVSGGPSLTQPKANVPRQYGTKILRRRPIPEQPQLSMVGLTFPPGAHARQHGVQFNVMPRTIHLYINISLHAAFKYLKTNLYGSWFQIISLEWFTDYCGWILILNNCNINICMMAGRILILNTIVTLTFARWPAGLYNNNAIVLVY